MGKWIYSRSSTKDFKDMRLKIWDVLLYGCGYYEGNEKSKRCQEKCGFVYQLSTEENKPCDLMGERENGTFYLYYKRTVDQV